MQSRARVHRAYKTERNVAELMQPHWPGATVGRGNGKDIVNVPMDIEVKARSDFNPMAWLKQSRKRTEKNGELNIVVCRMNGQGDDAAENLSFLKFSDLLELLVKAGYTDFQADTDKLEPVYCQCGNTIMKGSPCHICEKLDNASL